MTARDLIADIFSRPQRGVAGNMRRITRRQLDYLVGLIGEEQESGAVQRGAGASLVWMPGGREKYVITEDARGDRHTLTRLANVVSGGTGSLF
jgi:hypothetical protein